MYSNLHGWMAILSLWLLKEIEKDRANVLSFFDVDNFPAMPVVKKASPNIAHKFGARTNMRTLQLVYIV